MLSVSNEVQGDVNELKLVGRLDVKGAQKVEEAFSQAAQVAKDVVIDCSELDYIASAGLRALKHLRAAVHSNGGILKLRGVQEDVMEVLEMTGFAAMLTIE